jgi:hypothetical protein
VDDHELIKDYVFSEHISSLVTTLDSKHAFVGLSDGSLQQICIDSQVVIKEYGEFSLDPINSMAVTRDNNFLIAGHTSGAVSKISIPSQQLVKDFVIFGNFNIRRI